MSPLVAPALIALLLVMCAVLGPHLLRSAAPVLMRVPRLAVTLLLVGMGAWLPATAALSLVLAWALSGPSVLPGAYGEVCQRCLAASSPFAPGHTVETIVPVSLLVLLPALGAALLLGLGVRRAVLSHRAARSVADEIMTSARRALVLGQEIWVVRDPRPLAFSLPRRNGGIVISDGLRRVLSDEELTAVLAHERAHLQQRHHLIMSILRAVTEPLRWVPLVGAVADAVPHYLEIAADECARSHAGTPALASALLKIGAPVRPDSSTLHSPALSPLLHAGGPDRIRQLVAPAHAGIALLPLAALLLVTTVLAIVTLAVHGPYVQVVLLGCAIPV